MKPNVHSTALDRKEYDHRSKGESGLLAKGERIVKMKRKLQPARPDGGH